jgi:hypothetical protein
MRTFSLSETQEAKLKEWQETIKKIFGEYGKYDYIFSPTGIGDCVKVYSHITKKTIDLTEVENW